ncbi:hypothetical protein [Roseiconus lacunae]|uniref:Uncharacterized protein n=1 Tax=Roseiconus lacunae TaxID=2605694 RepID=A0ABT7PSH9_9BACT|nr:hypothetical protein [Roseiconus lacunae]MDM4019462.1 hypothetical protein [Roseiconus lacunae]
MIKAIKAFDNRMDTLQIQYPIESVWAMAGIALLVCSTIAVEVECGLTFLSRTLRKTANNPMHGSGEVGDIEIENHSSPPQDRWRSPID